MLCVAGRVSAPQAAANCAAPAHHAVPVAQDGAKDTIGTAVQSDGAASQRHDWARAARAGQRAQQVPASPTVHVPTRSQGACGILSHSDMYSGVSGRGWQACIRRRGSRAVVCHVRGGRHASPRKSAHLLPTPARHVAAV